jgi:DNA-binding CsgD family transcriptional regulator
MTESALFRGADSKRFQRQIGVNAMNQLKESQWEQVNQFLLTCGSVRVPRDFCVEIVRKINSLIPFDQARIYFINDNGTVYDEVLFGVEKEWSRAYIDYFSKINGGKWSIPHRTSGGDCRRLAHRADWNEVDWESVQDKEFLSDYVKPQGIRYSLGFGLHDANNMIKCVFCFDRIVHTDFTGTELSLLYVVHPHLENLHKNLTVTNVSVQNYQTQMETDEPLTSRESEIAMLLCEGVTPSGISKRLCLSLATIYKHIANIHKKLHVTNRQELLLKLIDANKTAVYLRT